METFGDRILNIRIFQNANEKRKKAQEEEFPISLLSVFLHKVS